jgi:hypothetical protein
MVSAGTGILLVAGLELCFGIGRYRLIMLFGALAGTGIGLLAWMVRRALDRGFRPSWQPVVAAAVPALFVFAAGFLWWIVPLIREEIRFNP